MRLPEPERGDGRERAVAASGAAEQLHAAVYFSKSGADVPRAYARAPDVVSDLTALALPHDNCLRATGAR